MALNVDTEILLCLQLTDTESNRKFPKHMRLETLKRIIIGYPTGGFSHSGGFESAQKHGLIGNTAQYKNFIISFLENTGSQNLPFLRESYQCANDLTRLQELDKICESVLVNHVANRASARQGKSFLDTSARTFDIPFLGELRDLLESRSIKGHHSMMFGTVCAHLNLDLQTTHYMFMFSALKNVIASSVRLGYVGPHEAQSVQYQLQKCIPDILERNKNLDLDEVCVCCPLVDVVQNVHDTMFAKLFYS